MRLIHFAGALLASALLAWSSPAQADHRTNRIGSIVTVNVHFDAITCAKIGKRGEGLLCMSAGWTEPVRYVPYYTYDACGNAYWDGETYEVKQAPQRVVITGTPPRWTETHYAHSGGKHWHRHSSSHGRHRLERDHHRGHGKVKHATTTRSKTRATATRTVTRRG